MIQKGRFVNCAGIVVQTSCDGQINREILLGDTEGSKVCGNSLQFRQAQIEDLISARIAFQCGNHFRVGAGNGDELQNLICLLAGQRAFLTHQNCLDLLCTDLVQFVHGAHNLTALIAQLQHGVETVEDFSVVNANLETAQTEALEDIVNNGRDFCLIQNVQLAIADDVDICLIELTETATLCPLATVDLGNLETAEGESQIIAVQRNVLCQRHRQVKTQCQIGIALLEAVDLFLGFTATLGKQNLRILNGRGIQRGEAVGCIGVAQDGNHALKLDLLGGQQFHEAGQGPGFDNIHVFISFPSIKLAKSNSEKRMAAAFPLGDAIHPSAPRTPHQFTLHYSLFTKNVKL